MANLPEKNVVLVDKITNVPTDSNLFINANGEFKQASVNDVIKSATVVSDTVNNAINDAMQDSIDSHFKQATGSPILLTDTADGTLIDFKCYGKSVQDGTPTPDSPIEIKSVADSGYFDGELLGGYYDGSGVFVYGSNTTNVGNKNPIPCKGGDVIKIIYEESISAITVALYDENMMFIDRPYKLNTNEFVITVPSNAKYMNFHLSADYIITPTTAKPITVTINGKYALIVKSKGKNLLENIATTQTINGVTFTVNDDKSVTVNGTATADSLLTLGTTTAKKGNEYRWSGCPSGGSDSTYYLFAGFTIDYYNQVKDYGYGSGTGVLSGDTTFESYIMVKSGTTINATFYPMIRKAEVTDTTYEPYKETVTYIPLSEPLRSSLDGTVTDEVSLSENKVTRRIVRKRIVTVSKNNSADVNNYCYYCAPGNVGRSNSGMSNNLPNLLLYEITINGTENIGQYVSAEYGGVVYINVGKHLTENTVEGMTKWLSENPTYIQYELAEPITETIEPVDIVTYDNVTYLTASDNADMEIEYPTTKVAGIASIGYSKGRKAEYEVELLKAQLLELQTAMVNSL